VICADPAVAAVQALVRSDPAGHAARELAERAELGLPPAVAAASLTGPAAAVSGLQQLLDLPEGTQALGPVPVTAPRRPGSGSGRGGPPGPPEDGDEPQVRLVLRTSRSRAAALAQALRTAQGVRSARRDSGMVRVRVDPRDLG
ncbi:MAG TPA: primosomal protein N', partial [Kineosporiaceae bacterium]|nr:primosomal protein N' [Kineosporiaceae bacterium]